MLDEQQAWAYHQVERASSYAQEVRNRASKVTGQWVLVVESERESRPREVAGEVAEKTDGY